MYLPSDLVCLEGWGRSFLVIDDLWESSGGVWTGICATVSENSFFFFGSPLLFSILDGGNKGWTGQGGMKEWDDITRGLTEMIGWAEMVMGLAKTRM